MNPHPFQQHFRGLTASSPTWPAITDFWLSVPPDRLEYKLAELKHNQTILNTQLTRSTEDLERQRDELLDGIGRYGAGWPADDDQSTWLQKRKECFMFELVLYKISENYCTTEYAAYVMDWAHQLRNPCSPVQGISLAVNEASCLPPLPESTPFLWDPDAWQVYNSAKKDLEDLEVQEESCRARPDMKHILGRLAETADSERQLIRLMQWYVWYDAAIGLIRGFRDLNNGILTVSPSYHGPSQ